MKKGNGVRGWLTGPQSSRMKKKVSHILISVVVYALLIEFVFVFLYPYLNMFIKSLQFGEDLRDVNRTWVLTGLNFSNYASALEGLDYWRTLLNNVIVVGLSTIGHVFSCSLAGYGLSRFKFPGNNLIFGIVLLSIMIPEILLIMPMSIQFLQWGWMGSMATIIVPSFLGFGLRGGLYIYIFRQFFRGLPRSYEESAKLEGCSQIGVFYRIMLPIGKTSILVVSTLSIIWHWNDYLEPRSFLKASNWLLAQKLDALPSYLFWAQSATGENVSPVQLAAAALVTLPILIIFAFIQKNFMKGIEFSGLAN